MIFGEDKHKKFLERRPHTHRSFSQGFHFSRRQFFELVGAGVSASYLVGNVHADEVSAVQAVTQNKAKNVIFILMTGAPSHTDTFDLKMVNGVTPSKFNPAVLSGMNWPTGLLPKIGWQFKNIFVFRYLHSLALLHSLLQALTQIGRN